MAAAIPNCISYDPTYAYELAVIVQDGMKRMFEAGEKCFYYITTMNENYRHPDMPEGVEEGIIRGLYQIKTSTARHTLRVQLMGAGAILREVEAAAEILETRYNICADIWSMTSINELARDGKDAQRWNMLNPTETPKIPFLTAQLQDCEGPFIAATDYIKAHTDQIRDLVPGRFTVLGTDGFGRSDTRAKLREFFEVDRRFVVLAALKSLADDAVIDVGVVAQAITELGINADKPNPRSV